MLLPKLRHFLPFDDAAGGGDVGVVVSGSGASDAEAWSCFRGVEDAGASTTPSALSSLRTTFSSSSFLPGNTSSCDMRLSTCACSSRRCSRKLPIRPMEAFRLARSADVGDVFCCFEEEEVHDVPFWKSPSFSSPSSLSISSELGLLRLRWRRLLCCWLFLIVSSSDRLWSVSEAIGRGREVVVWLRMAAGRKEALALGLSGLLGLNE